MADIKKFLDQQGVSTLWSKIATNLAAEEARAKKAEQDLQTEIDNLETYVGTIPADEKYADITNIVAFIQKRAQEVLDAASGGSQETAASVAAALEAYKTLNDPKVTKNAEDIAAIMEDYLKKADKDELAEDIKANADEILRIDAALKLAIDDENGEGLDSIKDLAAWIEEHGEDAAEYAAAIQALEALVGDTAVATQISNAIAAENLAQYAKTADIEGTLAKVDTEGSVTAAINGAINALNIGNYALAADLTALAARVTALENAGHQNAEQVAAAIDAKITALKNENLWDIKGAAADAESNAKTYTDTEIAKIQALSNADIDAAIAAATVTV